MHNSRSRFTITNMMFLRIFDKKMRFYYHFILYFVKNMYFCRNIRTNRYNHV